MKRMKGISVVSMLHYVRLVYRSALFILLLIGYIRFRIQNGETVIENIEKIPIIIYVTWGVFVIEMIMRFFPSKYESPGSQKQFACNYLKSGRTEISIQDNNATVLVALIWIVFNGFFGALHMAGVLDDGIMILLCSTYSVCDITCIPKGFLIIQMIISSAVIARKNCAPIRNNCARCGNRSKSIHQNGSNG